MGRNGTFTVYVHINPITDKAYVGQTRSHPHVRWRAGYAYKEKKKLFKDIKEIGWNIFKHVILDDNILTQERANELELYYINRYSNENSTYNINLHSNKIYKNPIKKPVYQIDNNFNIIAEFDSVAEATSKMLYDLEDLGETIDINNPSILQLIYVCLEGKRNNAFGYFWCKKSDYKIGWKPKELKRKKREMGKLGSNKLGSNKIFQYDLKGNFIKEWESMSEASKELNIHQTLISDVCRGKNKTTKGFIWKYEKDTDLSKNLNPKKTEPKKVIQYDLNGNVIKEWPSISSISKELNINVSQIWKVCRGKNEAYGFLWEYAEDSDNTTEKVV
jgi:hypothetical protein